jgi:hypothetical protein
VPVVLVLGFHSSGLSTDFSIRRKSRTRRPGVGILVPWVLGVGMRTCKGDAGDNYLVEAVMPNNLTSI